MSKLSEEELQSYYSRIHNNDREVLNSDVCSCLFCRQTYNAREVSDWAPNDDGTLNAICPVCGMETVVGDRKQGRIPHDELKEINLRFFGENFMENHPEALKEYIIRYFDGQITENKKNESLYKHYLTMLADHDDHGATIFLAALYLYGTKWTPRDHRLALSLYTRPFLENDEVALTQVGQILQAGEISSADHKKALEFYSKAIALGNGLARFEFADCYLFGLGVEADPRFAFMIYRSLWSEFYPSWRKGGGDNLIVFGDVCDRLGYCYENGLGVEQSDIDALRSYLIAEEVYAHEDKYGRCFSDLKRNEEETVQHIADLANKHGFRRDEPQGNFNTLIDSILDRDGQMPYFQKYILHLDSYDEISHEIVFSINSEQKQFIVSVENLFAGFIPGHTWWRLDGIIIEALEGDNEFNAIELNDKECKFVYRDEEKENVILHLELTFDEESENVAEGENIA